jgi:hypothetical protein
MTQLHSLLRHRKQEERTGDREQQGSKLSTVIQMLPYTPSLLLVADGSSAIIGVRNRNSAPCAKNITIAGQRETSASLRPRQNS